MNDTVKYNATGRRKNAVASVVMIPGEGQFEVNNRKLEEYFPVETLQMIIRQPLEATENIKKFNFRIQVKGGGISGQAGAVRHGIARALLKSDENLKPVLRKAGFLTRDPRSKERKKYGQKGARRRFQWTKR